MVYCNYKSHTDDSVTYDYGAIVSDITGELVFNFKNDFIDVVKEPQKEDVLIKRQLKSLYLKYRDEFRSGTYRDKISWEC